MCVYSMVMDHYNDKWKQFIPAKLPDTVNLPYFPPQPSQPFNPIPITKDEIDEFRKLLERAREYDKKNNQPDCEMESKKKKLLDLAKELGINIDFV